MIQFIKLSQFLFVFLLIVSCGNEEDQIPKTHENSEAVNMAEEIVDPSEEIDYGAMLMTEREANIAEFANAVLEDDIPKVAEFIQFPLIRQSPLPPIHNASNFEAYYPTLFDSTLKAKLEAHLSAPEIIDLTMSNGTAGILNGLIWFNDPSSKVVSINYNSEAEKKDQIKLEEYVRNGMHPILKNYTYNYFLGRTEEGLIRIDDTEKGLRYASWYGEQTMIDEPDFILWNGVSEKQGTAGGWTTTFDKVDTQYILDQVDMCEDSDDCGLFLVIKDEGIITSKLGVTEVLDPMKELTAWQEIHIGTD